MWFEKIKVLLMLFWRFFGAEIFGQYFFGKSIIVDGHGSKKVSFPWKYSVYGGFKEREYSV